MESGATIVESQIRDPATIGAHTLVEQSYFGPYSALGAHYIVHNSVVESSIMRRETQILNATVRIERSLLGREVVIQC